MILITVNKKLSVYLFAWTCLSELLLLPVIYIKNISYNETHEFPAGGD